MADISFDDLIPAGKRALTFDDLVPQPVKEGDWQGLGQRLAGAIDDGPGMGPPTRDDAEARRLQAAIREGLLYGQGRGRGETAFRAATNTFGLGLPNLLEAATSGWDSGLSLGERHEFIKAADSGRGMENPVSAAVGTGAGVVGQALALPLSAPATIAQAARQGAAIGGVTGGITSLANTRGDLGEAAVTAGVGAGLGGVAGGAVQAAMPVVKGAAQAIGDRVRFVTSRPETNAQRLVARSFEGVNPQQAQTILQNPNAFILDAGDTATRDLFRGATNVSPRAYEMATGALNNRASQEAATLSDDVTRALGGTNSVAQTQRGIADAARANTSSLYQQAAQEAPDVFDDALGRFTQTPVGQSVVKDAMARVERQYAERALAGEPVVRPPMPFVADELGNATLQPGMKVGLEFWDAAKKSLDDQIGVAQRAGEKALVSELTGIKRALVAKLDAASPSYAKARGAAAEAFGAEDAVDAGAMAARMQGDGRDITAMLAQLTPEQRLQYGQGFGADLSRQIAANERVPVDGGTRSVVANVFTPERMRRALEAAPDQQSAADLARSTEFWQRAAESRRSLGNSSTARQLATTAAIGGAPVAYSAAANQGMPDPKAVALGLALAGGRYAQQSRSAAIGDEIARILLSRGAIPQAPQTLAGQALTPTVRDAIVRALVYGGGITGGQLATQ